MRKKTFQLILALALVTASNSFAEDGYQLWLRYAPVTGVKLNEYRTGIKQLVFPANSAILANAKNELTEGLKSLLSIQIPEQKTVLTNGTLVAGTPESLKRLIPQSIKTKLTQAGDEGFVIETLTINQKQSTLIAANTDVGVLYGVFHFLKLLQTQQKLNQLTILDAPKTKIRLLNHWDNLDRTVERGYAGFSLWDWHKLPAYKDPRYKDYARANASIGINGTVLTNVNANALILTKAYLKKVKALADIFRTYGIKVYLTARFSAPIEIGELKTADPLDPEVQRWWKKKADEIYSYIPDFGGFLVKANSEGQPGPQNYGRNHAEGANMLAQAVKPHGGIVMWRAFVYDDKVPDDRAKQAYNEFKPLDGNFLDNVLIQVKNGPVDFQPREPFHPIFGAMPQTPLMMEFQITQEYLGFATHLAYLAPLFKECLDADTYARGKGSTVAKIVEGKLDGHSLSAMAGVANIGNDINWTGHPFGQANWYSFGRLAWNSDLSATEIAEEWLKRTFSNDAGFIKTIKNMMLNSREAVVNYMTPLGLHHLMGWSHHYGPGPWIKDKQRADWTSVYYHQADSKGIGFNRTSTGSNALGQYFPPVKEHFENLNSCPEEYLLWFHHLDWDYKMKSGKTLWEEIVLHYYKGAEAVKQMQNTWNSIAGKIDRQRFEQVQQLLAIQAKEAVWWRDACVLYFQSFSKREIPENLEKPDQDLNYYINKEFRFVPGI